ncbi:hypothetical protein KGF54_002914 [Candida jiufengensis]|uniref:uncharacterized protein n=1 Tax=Candida jiufengensis TaxID=497108 RepID=UPI0022255736|nr:uncharacterized protein KGF54_002914 [Candida jiufengensis]KAI5953542.1 hypothetical protein KGF54_002914 [Candida jiufengensis]
MLISTSKRAILNSSRCIIRFNSSKPNDNTTKSIPEFNLSDIFKRIDQVTVKANEIKKQNQLARENKRHQKSQSFKLRSEQNKDNSTINNDGKQVRSTRFQNRPQSRQQANQQQGQQNSKPFRPSSDQHQVQQQRSQQYQQHSQEQQSRPFRPQGQEDGTTNFFRNQSKNRTNGESNNNQQSSSTRNSQNFQKEGESANFQHQKQRQFNQRNNSFEKFSTTSYTPKLFESIGSRFPNNERRNSGRSKPWQSRGQTFRDGDNKSTTSSQSQSTTTPGQRVFKRTPRQPFSRDQQIKNTIAQPIESKELIADTLKPKLKSETFFYGKIPSILSTIDSRFASITKLSLLDSKYPFNLPKNIIDQAQPNNSQNKYILQKNWKLEPNNEILKNRVNNIVFGKIETIKSDAENKQLAHNIEVNPTMNIIEKQSMYDTITNLGNIKSIFKDAHWKQQKAN